MRAYAHTPMSIHGGLILVSSSHGFSTAYLVKIANHSTTFLYSLALKRRNRLTDQVLIPRKLNTPLKRGLD